MPLRSCRKLATKAYLLAAKSNHTLSRTVTSDPAVIICRHRNSPLLLRGYLDALVLAVMFFPVSALLPTRLTPARLLRGGGGGGGGGGGARPSLMAVPDVWVSGARQWGTHWLTFWMWEPCTFRVSCGGRLDGCCQGLEQGLQAKPF